MATKTTITETNHLPTIARQAQTDDPEPSRQPDASSPDAPLVCRRVKLKLTAPRPPISPTPSRRRVKFKVTAPCPPVSPTA